MYRKIGVLAFVLAFVFMTVPDLAAQRRIVFPRGSTSTTVSGTLRGGRNQEFVLGAQRGQLLSATLSSRGACVVFSQSGTSLSYTTSRGSNYIGIINTCNGATSYNLTVSIE